MRFLDFTVTTPFYFDNHRLRTYKNFYFKLVGCKVMAKEEDDLHTNNP